MTYWRTKHFKALQIEWYEKLKDTGFDDAEELIGEEMLLRQIAAHPYRGMDDLGITTKKAYYRFMSQMVEDTKFESSVDYLILKLFAEGTKIHSIVEALTQIGSKRGRDTVRFTIRKYEMKWGLRMYSPKQLHRKEPA